MANYSDYSDQFPAGSYSIRTSSPRLRSNFSVLARALDTESYFTSASASSVSAGVHKPGSARVFYGARATLATPASADSAGRLFYATDTGALLYLAASSVSTLVQSQTPYALSVLPSVQSISQATWTELVGSKLTVVAGQEGLYAVNVYNVVFAGTASAASFGRVGIVKNNAGGHVANDSCPLDANAWCGVSGITSAVSGDVFSVYVYHNANGAINVGSAGPQTTFQIVRIR